MGFGYVLKYCGYIPSDAKTELVASYYDIRDLSFPAVPYDDVGRYSVEAYLVISLVKYGWNPYYLYHNTVRYATVFG